MQTGAGRFVLLALLVAAGIGAAFSTWGIAFRIAELGQTERETADRVDRLLTAVAVVTAAQQAYVTPSSDRQAERVPALIEQIRTDTAGLRSYVRSVDAGRTLQGVADGASRLGQIEARAQEQLRLGQELMAADLIFSEARAAADAITSGLRDLRTAESAAFAGARAAALRYAWIIIGVVAALWALGLVLLARVPASRAAVARSLPAVAPLVNGDQIPVHTARPDLAVAADLCTAIARLTTADHVPVLLKRAASILDASGVVVWMAAGEELFAAAAFGYQPQVISRLGPISRAAINATAAAWRTGTLQVVTGELVAHGALVAPMLGSDRCIGVLAVEQPAGREEDTATRAVTTMFAAQLAAALAGWPRASVAEPQTVPPFDKAAEA